MRLLVIGHTYVVAENQKKIHALANLPQMELALVTPRVWSEPLLRENRVHTLSARPFAHYALKEVWGGREQYYWYLSLDLAMRRYNPDVLYVEQGAGAFVYSQGLIYRNLYAPGAKAAFFTWWNLPYRAKWPLSAIERFNLNQSQGAVAGNADAANILRDHGFNGPLTVQPQLGVDIEDYRPRDAAGLRRELGLDRFTVGYTGRFVEEKGIRVLLAALAGVDFDFQLLMVGRGPLQNEIFAFASEHGWGERLKIVSGIGHSEIARFQNCMDVMVVHSLTRPFWKEQFGHVIVEAMACGVPVIGSNSAEVPRTIGEVGVITPEGDIMALRAALNRMAASPELRNKLGEAGRKRVVENFTNQIIARQLADFLGSL